MMSSISPRTKKILFTLLWVLMAASCFGISGWGIPPYILAGLILVFLALLWLFPSNAVLKKVVFFGFIQLSFAILFLFIAWAYFFGKNYPLYSALFAAGLVALFASCWLVKP